MDRLTFCNFLAAALLAATLTACVPPPGAMTIAKQLPPPVVIQSEVDLIRMSHAVTDALVAELRKNHPSFHKRKPILIASIVNRNILDSTSELGLLIADHIGSRFTQQGYSIVEPKLRNDLAIRKEEGEFILSRDIAKLSQENKAYAVVVGNYTETRSVLDLTARIIQIKNRQVLAAVDAKIPLGITTRDLLLNTGGGTPLTVVKQ